MSIMITRPTIDSTFDLKTVVAELTDVHGFDDRGLRLGQPFVHLVRGAVELAVYGTDVNDDAVAYVYAVRTDTGVDIAFNAGLEFHGDLVRLIADIDEATSDEAHAENVVADPELYSESFDAYPELGADSVDAAFAEIAETLEVTPAPAS